MKNPLMTAQRLLIVCFFLSGTAGLVYQIVWVRILSLVFGNTVYAVSIVVAAFLAGLALGSHYWGKSVDASRTPLKTYIRLEIGIAVAALLITFGIYLIDDVIVGIMTVDSIGSGGWQLLRFLLVFVTLLLPTALMGGTMPVMGKIYVNSFEKVGLGIGSLYAANTYGAMTGAFVSGFLLIPLLTVQGALSFAVLLNVIVAAALYIMKPNVSMEEPPQATGRKSSVEGKKKKKTVERKKESKRGFLPFGVAFFFIALSGFGALAFEILWTRAFVVSFGSTVYLFSNLLTVFLLGMALGSHVFSKWLDKVNDPLRLFGLAQIGIGILGTLSVIFFLLSDGIFLQLGHMFGQMNWMKHVLITFILMACVFLPPTFLMGVGYPLICRATTRSLGSLGRDVGILYAVGTAGGIIGSLAAGFILLPLIGLQKGIFLVSAVSLAAGYTALLKSSSRKGLGWLLPVSAVSTLVIFIGMETSGINIGYGSASRGAIVFAEEGVMGAVRVTKEKEGGPLNLWVNNYRLAASGDVSARFGHIPLLIKPDARDVLIISLGSGITAGSVGGHPVENIECVEIVPTLLNVQRFFEKDNHDIVSDPRFKLTFWDGRHYIRVTDKKYDLVISDLFQPDSAGVGSLYSLEHFLNVKSKLKNGGAMAQWLPMYQLSPKNLKVIMKTFAVAFENVMVWYGDFISEQPALMLFGSKGPITIRLDMLAKSLEREAVKADMIEFYDPLSFLSSFIMDRNGVLDFAGDSPINTDNNAVIEYNAPRNIWERRKYAVINFSSFITLRQRVTPFVEGAENDHVIRDSIERYYNGRTLILQGKVDHAYRNYQDEWQKFQEAAKYVPHDPALGFVSLDLGYLYYYNRDYRKASAILEWSKQVNPNIPETYLYLAESYEGMGKKQSAADIKRELTGLM